ncbi:MAG: hypothetical protein JWM11_4005, partial [Planctomycetaceae bacterium]|nr:hypothetical protein [Planctomycetaceae bacterium]
MDRLLFGYSFILSRLALLAAE